MASRTKLSPCNSFFSPLPISSEASGGAALLSFLSWVRESLLLWERFPPIWGCRRELDQGPEQMWPEHTAQCWSSLLLGSAASYSHALERAGLKSEKRSWNITGFVVFLPLHWLHRHQPPQGVSQVVTIARRSLTPGRDSHPQSPGETIDMGRCTGRPQLKHIPHGMTHT